MCRFAVLKNTARKSRLTLRSPWMIGESVACRKRNPCRIFRINGRVCSVSRGNFWLFSKSRSGPCSMNSLMSKDWAPEFITAPITVVIQGCRSFESILISSTKVLCIFLFESPLECILNDSLWENSSERSKQSNDPSCPPPVLYCPLSCRE